MIASELMFKIWDGDAQERFTYVDMNRLGYNANLVASYLGIPQETFVEATRASQFRYDEAQKLEDLIQACADEANVPVDMEQYWNPMRSVSYIDFDRWESSLFNVYKALGGLGERIEAGTVLSTYSFTLFPSSWSGSGPYHIDLDAPGIHDDTEAVFFVPHTASVSQRAAEYAAVLKPEFITDRRIRIVAVGAKPSIQIPVRLIPGGFQMYEIVTLSASDWSGSGPWVQTKTLINTYTNAVIGPQSGMSNEEVEAMSGALVSVSEIDGRNVTFRAIGDKPSITLNVGIMGA